MSRFGRGPGHGPDRSMTDEELLIQLARRQRRVPRSRRDACTMLAIGVFYAVVAAVVLGAGMGPISLGFGLGFLIVGAQAAIAALALGIAAAATALSSSGQAAKARVLQAQSARAQALGPCPACGSSTLREHFIRYVNGGATPLCGGAGVATLCSTPGCDYATARVTRRRTFRASLRSAVHAAWRSHDRCRLLTPGLGSSQPL